MIYIYKDCGKYGANQIINNNVTKHPNVWPGDISVIVLYLRVIVAINDRIMLFVESQQIVFYDYSQQDFHDNTYMIMRVYTGRPVSHSNKHCTQGKQHTLGKQKTEEKIKYTK